VFDKIFFATDWFACEIVKKLLCDFDRLAWSIDCKRACHWNIGLLKNFVHLSSIPEYFLRFKIVNLHKILLQLAVLDSFIDWESLTIKTYHSITFWPFFYRLVQDHLLIKLDNLKLIGRTQMSEDSLHRLGSSLFIHGDNGNSYQLINFCKMIRLVLNRWNIWGGSTISSWIIVFSCLVRTRSFLSLSSWFNFWRISVVFILILFCYMEILIKVHFLIIKRQSLLWQMGLALIHLIHLGYWYLLLNL